MPRPSTLNFEVHPERERINISDVSSPGNDLFIPELSPSETDLHPKRRLLVSRSICPLRWAAIVRWSVAEKRKEWGPSSLLTLLMRERVRSIAAGFRRIFPQQMSRRLRGAGDADEVKR